MLRSAATLPGSEDLEGLEALLDPSTLEGRVARISLMTRGPGAMSLALPLDPGDLPSQVEKEPRTADPQTEHNVVMRPPLGEIRHTLLDSKSVNYRVVSASASVSRKVSTEGLRTAAPASPVTYSELRREIV